MSQLPYQVSGPILDNYERVVLTGKGRWSAAALHQKTSRPWSGPKQVAEAGRLQPCSRVGYKPYVKVLPTSCSSPFAGRDARTGPCEKHQVVGFFVGLHLRSKKNGPKSDFAVDGKTTEYQRALIHLPVCWTPVLFAGQYESFGGLP